jgi:hypothetical protein
MTLSERGATLAFPSRQRDEAEAGRVGQRHWEPAGRKNAGKVYQQTDEPPAYTGTIVEHSIRLDALDDDLESFRQLPAPLFAAKLVHSVEKAF